MKTVFNPTTETIRVANLTSAVAVIAPEKTKKIPDSLFDAACAAGCIVPEANGEAPVDPSHDATPVVDDPTTPGDETKVPQLVEAINQVLAEDNPELLTNSGCPKVSVLKKIVGDHTADDRDLAWEQVQSQSAAGDA